MNEPQFIVAEISRTWTDCGNLPGIISNDFEKVIATNLLRGYLLYSFAHSQVMTGASSQQETIIAVFRFAPLLQVAPPVPE